MLGHQEPLIRILAISGSLRTASLNTAVLSAAAIVAPPEAEIILYTGLGDLPAFNPDLDTGDLPEAVQSLRRQIGQANGLIISSPEYARGVPGSLKNALDWLVSSFEFPGKPVALINTSPRAMEAQAQLRLILTTMSARLVDEASINLPLLGQNLDANKIALDATLSGQLRDALEKFIQVIRTEK